MTPQRIVQIAAEKSGRLRNFFAGSADKHTKQGAL
jgi:hypothetical protein